VAVAARRARVITAGGAPPAVMQSATAARLVRGNDASMVIGQVEVQLKALLGLRGCAFEAGPGRARGLCLDPGGLLRRGVHRRPEEHGFRDEKIDVPAHYRGRVYGRFVLDPTPGTAPTIHARRTAVVLAELAAAAIAGELASSALQP